MTDATHCQLISTDGIAKSCVKAGIPYSSSFSGSLTNYVRDELPNHPFVLVTGAADTQIPAEFPDAHKVFENPFMRAWFTQNYSGHPDPRIQPVPVGLDYHTLEVGRAPHWGPQATAVDQEAEYLHIKNLAPKLEDRKIQGYCNHHLNLGWIPERQRAIELPERASLHLAPHWMSRRQTLFEMSQYAFVPSPFGVGMDCHRTWEALILGCIPIVNMSPLKPMFDGLPVWFVDDWRQVNVATMHKVLEQFQGKTFAWEKLTLKYWMDKIHKATGRNITYAKP